MTEINEMTARSWSFHCVLLSAVLAAAVANSSSARADPSNALCTGCVVVGAETGEPRPLLVVLHGDEGSPTKVLGAWKLAAEKAHVTLFAPRCPASEGCAGSWWRWDGNPNWLLGRVEALEKQYPVDPKHRYLAGWSGGTTYATFHIPAWFPTFAAVSLAGGGATPHDSACLPHAGGACAPVHYLQGDKNPLFAYAVGAHAYLTGCGHDVTWELHEGADHAGEWRAYERETATILDWLLARPEGCSAIMIPPQSTSAMPSVGAEAMPSVQPRPTPSPSTNDILNAPPRIQPEPRCTCSMDSSSSSSSGAWLFALGAFVLHSRRARRSSTQARDV